MLSNDSILATPYAVFSGAYVNETKEVLQNFLLVSFANKTEFTIGRGEKFSDLFDETDKSVSRLNSEISYRSGTLFFKEGRIYIKDRKSKHGTGVLLKSPITLSNNQTNECLIYKNMLLNMSFGKLSAKP